MHSTGALHLFNNIQGILYLYQISVVKHEVKKMDKRFKLLIVGLLVLLMAFVGVVSAARTGPDDFFHNENCADIHCPAGYQYKIEAPLTDIETLVGSETFTNSDGFSVTVTVQAYDPSDPSFDPDGDRKLVTWTSNWPASAVITKDGGGQHVFVYRYDGETSDKLSPSNYGGIEIPPNANTYGEISHITFCYGEPEFPAPEFPTIALPMAMLIGVVGVVYLVRKREN